MPFSVFRRHQRKLITIFGIMAMLAFVVSDSLPSLMNSGNGPQADSVVTELYGDKVYRSELDRLRFERGLANAFMANLQSLSGFPGPQPPFFGDTTTRDLVDALILEHEADRLKMPSSPALARQWLSEITGGQMNAELFEAIRAPFSGSQGVTGEQMLTALANQIRLMQVRRLPGQPLVTPLDVYQEFRDRYETVSAKAVRFPVSDYVGKVGEPTAAQVQALYDQYKDRLPDPSSPKPGFKIPRRVKVEYLSLDGGSLERDIRNKLTDDEVRKSYEARRAEFALTPPQELPAGLFADAPEGKQTTLATDPKNLSTTLQPDPDLRTRPLAEVRPIIEADLAEERAREVIDRRLEAVRETMLEFADTYNDVVDENQESGGSEPLPAKPDLKPQATRADLALESTPLLSRAEAETYGQISSARVGLTRSAEGRSFAEEFFAAGETLFEPIELTDALGRVYLAWKIEDRPERVPTLKEVRDEVVRAWKREQARPLAQKAAEEVARAAKAACGTLSSAIVGDREILTTDPLPKLESTVLPMPGQFSPPRPRPTEIPQIPNAGDPLRDTLFGLEPGEVAVAPDQPEADYYVLALERRTLVSYSTLYAPSGPRMSLQTEVLDEAGEQQFEAWMNVLRAQAGLPADWTPPDDENDRRQG